jgi:hypothetical protein
MIHHILLRQFCQGDEDPIIRAPVIAEPFIIYKVNLELKYNLTKANMHAVTPVPQEVTRG